MHCSRQTAAKCQRPRIFSLQLRCIYRQESVIKSCHLSMQQSRRVVAVKWMRCCFLKFFLLLQSIAWPRIKIYVIWLGYF